MSAQFDLIPDIDVTALPEVSAAQFQQSLTQLRPLANIGLNIYQAGTSLAASFVAGTNGSPDVANNPRMARYVWLNTYAIATAAPTPYLYKPDTNTWVIQTVSDASITSTQLAAHVDALTHMFTAAAVDAALADKVLVYDSSGQYVTQITRAALLSSLTINLNQISLSGAAVNQVIKNVAGAVAWANLNLSTDPLDGTLPLAKLTSGTEGYILRVVGGVPVWITTDDTVSDFLPDGTVSVGIGIDKIKLGAATADQFIGMNAAGTALEYKTQSLIIGTALAASTVGILSTSGAGTIAVASHPIAHGLGVVPKIVRAVIVCTVLDTGVDPALTVGAEIPVESLFDNTNSAPAAGVIVDATTVTVSFRQVGAAVIRIIPSAGSGVRVALTPGSWKVKIYAWE